MMKLLKNKNKSLGIKFLHILLNIKVHSEIIIIRISRFLKIKENYL